MRRVSEKVVEKMKTQIVFLETLT